MPYIFILSHLGCINLFSFCHIQDVLTSCLGPITEMTNDFHPDLTIICLFTFYFELNHLWSWIQVDDRFNQCLDEIHTAVSAFHAVTELDPNILARFALPTISFMYKNLRDRISCHILAMGANFSEGREKEEKSFEASFIDKQWALQQLRKRDHPLWRPQRGLPERSVSVLRAWMFQNFLHPWALILHSFKCLCIQTSKYIIHTINGISVSFPFWLLFTAI